MIFHSNLNKYADHIEITLREPLQKRTDPGEKGDKERCEVNTINTFYVTGPLTLLGCFQFYNARIIQ